MKKRTTQTSNSEAKYDFTDLFNEILGTETSKKLFEDLATIFLMDPAKHATAAKNAEKAREKEAEAKTADIKPVKAETINDKNQQILDLIRELTATFKEYVKTTDERLQDIDYKLHAQELQFKDLTALILGDENEDSEDPDEDCDCDGDCEHCCLNDDGNCDESYDIEDENCEDCDECSAGAKAEEPMVRLGFKNGICVCIPARMLDTVFCPEVEGHSEIGVFKDGEEINTHDGAGAIITSVD